MADLPSVYNPAIDAVVAQILADIAGSVCERVSWLIDHPHQWWEKDSWPSNTRLVVAVIDGAVEELDPVQVESYVRGQGMDVPIRAWSVNADQTALSGQRIDDRRRVFNAIEAVGAANPFEDGWTVDWETPAGRLDNDSNRPPYAAWRAGFRVRAWE